MFESVLQASLHRAVWQSAHPDIKQASCIEVTYGIRRNKNFADAEHDRYEDYEYEQKMRKKNDMKHKMNSSSRLFGIEKFLDKEFKSEAIESLKTRDLKDVLPSKLRELEVIG